ncbi:MAG: ammonia permease, partial [Clostridia bacterium]|nr:ammonia permease [Clostridia bacterium]
MNNAVNGGDVSFMLISSALVLLMTPGLAFFYVGMVRRKNTLNTMMSSFFIMGLASVMWVLVGFTLSFGPDLGGIVGSLKWFGLNGVGTAPGPYSQTIPNLLFCAFQMMFAVITPA